ncbi:hypothetical protein GCM10020000_18780 [Streptomyces olivoverticillatus]
MDPPQRLARRQPVQRLQAERVLAQGEGALVPEVAYPELGQVLRAGVLRAVDDPQVLPAPALHAGLDELAALPAHMGPERLDDHALAAAAAVSSSHHRMPSATDASSPVSTTSRRVGGQQSAALLPDHAVDHRQLLVVREQGEVAALGGQQLEGGQPDAVQPVLAPVTG